ncbi:hypothetical protein COLO4_14330 [Corchorus olitorius]|uniref:Uncharacterized protein n=1 Tax=Corchorus olitorius TaxID=93759 RepID=A0A1R3JSJ8_9ROSI|nr:hypothetical protein COLO4_14330 [Corchorus olitorius]
MEETRNKQPKESDVKVSNNKRKLSVAGDDDFQKSYFRICCLLRQLRPHVIQVLQTPDFRNCKAAHEIRENLKLVSDLCKQMMVEGDSNVNLVSEQQNLSTENVSGKPTLVKCQCQEGRKEAKLLKTEHCVENVPAAIKLPIPSSSSSEQKLNDGEFRGSYVIGGSVFGWNFITYRGSKPVYYGPSKDSYLSRKMKSC